MAPRTSATLVLAMVLAATVLAPPAMVRGAISCSAVYSTLMPCLQFVQGGGAPSRGCCSGIQSLLAEANNTPDRRTICGCLKNVANGASGGPYITRAAALPSKCNVALPYKISPDVNCDSIH